MRTSWYCYSVSLVFWSIMYCSIQPVNHLIQICGFDLLSTFRLTEVSKSNNTNNKVSSAVASNVEPNTSRAKIEAAICLNEALCVCSCTLFVDIPIPTIAKLVPINKDVFYRHIYAQVAIAFSPVLRNFQLKIKKMKMKRL